MQTAVDLYLSQSTMPGRVGYAQIAQRFGLPMTTLYNAVRAARSKRTPGTTGRPRFLNEEAESQLASMVRDRQTAGDSMTVREVMDEAERLRQASLSSGNLPSMKPLATCTRGYVASFMSRNGLALFQPTPVEARRFVVSREQLDDFRQLLGSKMRQHNYDPLLIFNMDETSVRFDRPLSALKVVGREESKVAVRMTEDPGIVMTAWVTISASGLLLRTLLIIKREHPPRKPRLSTVVGGSLSCMRTPRG